MTELRVLEGGRRWHETRPGLRRLTYVILWLAAVGAISIVLGLVFLVVILVG